MNEDSNQITTSPALPAVPAEASPRLTIGQWWESLFAAEPARPPDIVREIFETVVFVVVLVLLLKSFAAEAFVIPTGSMATTLLGYNKQCKCPACGYVEPVNCSDEVERGATIDKGVCQNDWYPFTMSNAGSPSCSTGDRVLVAKYFYDGPFSTHSTFLREVAAILAILLAAVLGGNAAGKLTGWFRRSSDQTHPRRFLLPTRIVGGVACAVVVGYCAFATGPATAMTAPERFDVVVFKYPVAPQQGFTPVNYIKRLVGKPGETIAIKAGKLYVLPAGALPSYSREEEEQLELDQRHVPLAERTPEYVKAHLPELMWHRDHMHPDDSQAAKLFRDGRFEIIRKSPDKILAMMRLVYDNDHPPTDVTAPQWERWQSTGTSWTASGRRFDGASSGPGTQWLRYHHLIPHPVEMEKEVVDAQGQKRKTKEIVWDATRVSVDKERLITDILGYNTNTLAQVSYNTTEPAHDDPWTTGGWVSDLIVETDATIEDANGQMTLELSKAKNRFRARWELASGTCTLLRVDNDQKEEELARTATSFKGKGTKRRLRFANVDDRLTVWVDSTLPFKSGEHPEGGVNIEKSDLDIVPTRNDFEPASIGLSSGASVRVQSLKLFRDIYYTNFQRNFDMAVPSGMPYEQPDEANMKFEDWQEKWQQHLQKLNTLYVQPGHYLCFGDNSSHSADSRSWGLVPERLMLGRALLVYWPISRVGSIR